MTPERLEALHGLVAAVQAWARSPAIVTVHSPEDQRVMEALVKVEACGADVAVVVAPNTAEPPA